MRASFSRAAGRGSTALRARARRTVRCLASSAPVQQAKRYELFSPELTNAGPEPSKFAVADGQLGNIAAAAWSAVARAGTGGFAPGYSAGIDAAEDGAYSVLAAGGRRLAEGSRLADLPRPALPLELYEFTSCPFCRKVREAVSALALDCVVYPTPKGGERFRPRAVERGGKAQFPFLVDPNTGDEMYESDAIVEHLYRNYGGGVENVPLALRLGAATTLTCGLALAPRAGRGGRARPSVAPAAPLALVGYEMSPFVLVVKEVLSELELPYQQVSMPRGDPRRQQMVDARGAFQVPYLEDPGRGVYLFESSAIVEYLERHYGAGAAGAGAGAGAAEA